MVNISIIAEGGVFETNQDAATVDNSNALREALHRIFAVVLDREDVSITVSMSTGKNAAARAFRDSTGEVFLFTDLDFPPEKRMNWFVKMKAASTDNPIIFTEEKARKIFFMIQEMEAWLLKQPAAIEQWAAENGYQHFPKFGNVANHRMISGKNIEQISKPSDRLADIIKQTFQSGLSRKTGKPKGVVYGKLKHAPGLLNCLDVNLLLTQDAELSRFRETLSYKEQ